jgi:hypothetical protein
MRIKEQNNAGMAVPPGLSLFETYFAKEAMC